MVQYDQQTGEQPTKTWPIYRTRQAGLAGLLGGASFILYAIPDVIDQATFSGMSQLARVYSFLLVVPLVLMLFGVLGVHAYHKGAYGRMGTIGYGMSTIGLVIMILTELYGVSSAAAYAEEGWFMIFVVSLFVLVLGGGLPFGLAMRRAKKLPALGPTILAVALPVCVAGFAGLLAIGFEGTPFVVITTVYGAAWAILGYHLWTQPTAASIAETAPQ